MKNKFNEFLDEVSLQIETMLVFGPIFLKRIVREILRLDVNILISKHSINLNTSKYPLIKITEKEIIFDNIKAIIADYVIDAKLNSEKYIHIFNDKGQLISDCSWTINEEYINNPDIYIVEITKYFKHDCREYTFNTKPWWLLSNATFFIYLSDKDPFGGYTNY